MTLCLALRLGLGAIFGGGATPPEPYFPQRTLYVDPDTQTDFDADTSEVAGSVIYITMTADAPPFEFEDHS